MRGETFLRFYLVVSNVTYGLLDAINIFDGRSLEGVSQIERAQYDPSAMMSTMGPFHETLHVRKLQVNGI
jgi:hypothetical protein